MGVVKSALVDAQDIVQSLESVYTDDEELARRAKSCFAMSQRSIAIHNDMGVADYFVSEAMKIRRRERAFGD